MILKVLNTGLDLRIEGGIKLFLSRETQLNVTDKVSHLKIGPLPFQGNVKNIKINVMKYVKTY